MLWGVSADAVGCWCGCCGVLVRCRGVLVRMPWENSRSENVMCLKGGG
ncbi:hypothetical protein [Bartonella raoultii]|nr:hypothetical protein [Bartonella raoultii]